MITKQHGKYRAILQAIVLRTFAWGNQGRRQAAPSAAAADLVLLGVLPHPPASGRRSLLLPHPYCLPLSCFLRPMLPGSMCSVLTRMTSAQQERLTYTASGMVTNIAARLCVLATRGEIYLSETTAHLVRHQFALHEPTSEHLKNLSAEVKVYKLL